MEVCPMKMDRMSMGKWVLATACIAGLAGCDRARDVSDVQLTQLLRAERASPQDPRAPLDPSAVDCLRAWSGDADLAKTLQPAAADEAAKTACKPKIEAWLADANRNPGKFAFKDVSAPPTVKRAVALLAEHRSVAANMPSATDKPPAALMRPATPAAVPAPADPGPVDLSAATAALDELDGLCQKAKQAAASGATNQPIARYASYCENRISQMRTRVQMVAAHGDAKQAKMVTDNAQRVLEVGRQLAAQANSPQATQTKNQ
jgi:hypothetical protein